MVVFAFRVCPFYLSVSSESSLMITPLLRSVVVGLLRKIVERNVILLVIVAILEISFSILTVKIFLYPELFCTLMPRKLPILVLLANSAMLPGSAATWIIRV